MELSRRNFLAGAAATAAVAGAAASMTVAPQAASAKAPVEDTSSWLGEAPEVAESDIVDTRDCELLIVGAGNAGMAAAASAAELGMDFIVAEKGAVVGQTRHWLGAVNSKYVLDAGYEDNKGQVLNELARYASGKCDMRVWKVWNRRVRRHDRLARRDSHRRRHDLRRRCRQPGPHRRNLLLHPRTEHYYSGNDAAGNRLVRNEIFERYINSLGYNVDYETVLVKLEREDGGRVTGGIFQTPDGLVRINASQGVLLATGGYPANPAMCQELSPIIDRVVSLVYYNTNDTGDGIKAALWVGAQMDEDPAPMLFNRGLVKPGENAGYTSTEGTGSFAGVGKQYNIGSQPFMKVARDGRRYCNESAPYDFDLNAIAEKPGGVFCQVFDANAKEDIMRFNTIGCSRQIQQQLGRHEGTLEEFFADKIEEGTIFVADTIEELADKLGFEGEAKETFLAEVRASYNELLRRPRGHRLRQGGLPPLRAAHPAVLRRTLVRRELPDHRRRSCASMQNMPGVIDIDFEVIAGLYCRRRLLGQRCSANNYPELVVACACGRTVTFGRHVARHVAEQAGYDVENVTKGDPTFGAPTEAPEPATPAGELKDGTYEAEGKGIGGKVPVTVTVEGGKVASVTVGENSETQGIGSKAVEQLPEAIVAANGTAGVDGVSGATIASKAIFSAVEDAMAQASA